MIGAVFLGGLSARFGREKMFIAEMIILTALLALLVVCDDFISLVICVCGLGAGGPGRLASGEAAPVRRLVRRGDRAYRASPSPAGDRATDRPIDGLAAPAAGARPRPIGMGLNARLRQLLARSGETFWLVPAALVVGGILLGLGLIHLDRVGAMPRWLIDSPWLYNGDGTGARTLLGAVASSTIGVAGTVFSITIAALSLAAGQMGPRLLRNFTRDRGNQLTLGAFLGTFSYALMVLRSVRTEGRGGFVPHLALSVSILLAFVCVGMLVFFVGHMAGRINVDTVVELVSHDLRLALARLSLDAPPPVPPDEAVWRRATPVPDMRRGYLQHLDEGGLADWAARHGTALRLLVRPGDHVFPGAPIALADPAVDGIVAAIREATALGASRGSADDLGFPVRQLVEVAVRALSPGINDPHTAVAVLDRLGEALCDLVPVHLSSGVTVRDGRAVLVVPALDYDGLADAMFDEIRQNAAGSVSVLTRLADVLVAVATCEHRPDRVPALRRHAGLVLADARREVPNGADLAGVVARCAKLVDAAH